MRDGDRQDKLERRWLGVFLANCEDAPAGTPRRPPSRRPDFIVDTESGLLGIEVTFLFRETGVERQDHQAQEARRERILEAARAAIAHRLGALPNVGVSIFWQPQLVAKEVEGPLAEALAGTIVTALSRNPPVVEAMERLVEWEDLDAALQDHVDEVVLQGLPPDAGFHFFTPGARWLTPDQPDLAARIREKESKLNAYLRECARCWLVIVAGTAGPASWLQRPDEVRQSSFRSKFDRVYLVDGFSGGTCRRLC